MAQAELAARRRKVNDRASKFFNSAYETFLTRSPDHPDQRVNFAIADRAVRIETVDRSLASMLMSALDHLRGPCEGDVNFTIAAWDTPETDMVSPAWSESDYGPRGEIHGFNNGRFRTAFDHGTAALSMVDLDTGRGIFWTRDATKLPPYESASPLRSVLSWWLQANGRVLIHAAAITFGDAGILLAGPGGSGKSTTALICLAAGWGFLADDYCALEVGKTSRVFGLYGSMKIDDLWLQESPQARQLAGLSPVRHGGKRIIFAHKHWPERMRRVANCRLVLLPRVTNAKESSTSPATPAQALRALAPTSMFQTLGDGASMFQAIAEFVRRVPARWLNLGREIEAIPDVIARSLTKEQ